MKSETNFTQKTKDNLAIFMARLFDKSKKVSVDRFDDLENLLEELRDRMMNLQGRINFLERIVQERLPEKALTERKFMAETQAGDELVERIASTIKTAVESTPNFALNKDVDMETIKSIKSILDSADKTIVEKKRMDKIVDMLKRHQKLTSTQLSQLLGLSRTRCNEYFKEMENLEIVESVVDGREKFYALKNFN
jgi:predicted transcriptional regulator